MLCERGPRGAGCVNVLEEVVSELGLEAIGLGLCRLALLDALGDGVVMGVEGDLEADVAGIGLIPKEYYEAAEVFGASPWQRFLRVTLPLLRPSLSTALILRVILALEVFAVVQALGGTLFPVLMGETYKYQFELLNGGAAAAIALIILGVSIAFTLVILRVLRVPKGATI